MVKDKEITTVYVDPIIKKYCKDSKLNLSEWVNMEFIHQFLSQEGKEKELAELKLQEATLIKEIEDTKKRRKMVSESLTTQETRYITTVTARVANGHNIKNIHRCFNHDFKRNFTLEHFRSLVHLHEKRVEQRLEYAFKKHKK